MAFLQLQGMFSGPANAELLKYYIDLVLSVVKLPTALPKQTPFV